MNQNSDLTKQSGQVRTQMDCHNCHKNFIATIDYEINGNHSILCAYCGHEHQRVIRNGVMTQERWGSTPSGPPTQAKSSWSHQSLAVETSMASAYLKDRWRNRSDRQQDGDDWS